MTAYKAVRKLLGRPMQLGCREHRSIFAGSNVWVYSSYWNYYYEADFDTASISDFVDTFDI